MRDSGPAPYVQRKKRTTLFLSIGGGVLIFLLFLGNLAWHEAFKNRYTQVSFLDVGQGDAIFIRTPQGRDILIDGGPDDRVLEKLELFMPFWDKEIDLVMLSHPALDHVTGLLSVLKEYKVKAIVWTGVKKDTRVFRQWLDLLQKEKEEGAEVFLVSAPARIEVEQTPCPQYFDILFPLEDLSETTVVDDNDTSIVAKGVFCEHSVLFTGDLTIKGENLVLKAGSNLAADILKVGHHGSKTSSSPAFLEAVAPTRAVIQAGKDNQYGHPHPEVLERLREYGIQVLRTDEAGDITFKFPL